MTVAPQLATLPLTAAQQGLLVVHGSVPVPHLYNVLAELELDPALAPADLGPALRAVLAVQPALRLAVRERPAPHAELGTVPDEAPLRVVPTNADGFDRRRAELLEQLGGHAFDLERPPLLRTVLLHTVDRSRSTLLLVVHHLVFDGFSLRQFVRDLTSALRAELDVDRVRVARERALCRELAAQQSAADEEHVERTAAELADRLRSAPATVLHPRPNRPATTAFTGARREIRLSPERSRALGEVCAELGVSPFVFFSAVYAALLARHSGNTPVVFGSPVLARRTLGSLDLCGFFVNTLPLVVDVDWDQPFDVFVTETVRAEADRVKGSAAVSFDRVVRLAAPDRSTNRNPVFSCMLAMQDATDAEPGSAVLRVREHGNGTAKFDLWLGVTPGPDGWLLELEHDRELLPEPLVGALADSLTGLLEKAVERPGTVLAELFEDASSDESRAHDGFWRRPAHPDLRRWVRTALARRPEATAVEEDGRRVTYGELQELVRSAAAGLARHGVGPGTVVGLTTPTLGDTVVAVLAVLERQAVFLPLDLTLPGERLAYMTGKAGCRLVVGHGAVDGARVVALSELAAAGDDAAPPAGEAAAGGDGSTVLDGSDDGVYIMFTSGSTGRPKGVLMGNGPLVNLTAWQLDALDMDERTRFLQYAPLGFDVSFQEIVPTLVAGGTLVSREPADRRDLPAVLARVSALRISHVYLPVAALRPFTRAAQDAGDDLPELRHLCVSGEQLLLDDGIRRFLADRPHISLVNLYGPTETHAVTTHRLTGAGPLPNHVPIGRPITHTTAHVVDATGHLAPLGVPGELHLGGACPAHGYVGDPERTAERFLPDPRGGRDDARMYRTGDQVLRDEQGTLLFLGRDDDQVKIRGYRVELGELETAAAAHADVRLAVAAVLGEGADRQLALFFVPEDGRSPLPDDVRRRVTGAVPGYMAPSRVFEVASVPVTRNGKVDRPALLKEAEKAVREEAASGGGAVTTAQDPLEAWLQHLWQELLGRADVPVDRSLLDYGAHSLNVMTARAAIEERHGVQIPVLDFFLDPTIRAQAGWITRSRDGAR
ncbi:non-ribosomal peptide synthetase [Streptomyces sp. P3]|uniref:non-ribosomal peptide synthetase n=1 Tax=Streptomyces sp. P3 TaxID=2135430 RepID=UPI000D19A0B9|nr:non-ribosomal peptide synthetase [Streptomyces sp. P3]AVV46718.1 non-ribosomal peptide synthetase [Streptomyces sp. P3]